MKKFLSILLSIFMASTLVLSGCKACKPPVKEEVPPAEEEVPPAEEEVPPAETPPAEKEVPPAE